MEPTPSEPSDPGQDRLRALQDEREEIARQLAQASEQVGRLRVRLEELEDQHRFDQQRIELLHGGMSHGAPSSAQARALIRHVARTQAILDARTKQLSELMSSYWYRLAVAAWHARRRRPPLGTIALLVVSLGAVIAVVLLADSAGAILAGVLGAAIIAELALLYAIVIPARRDKRAPRLAGQGTFADPLPDETATVDALLALADAEPDESSAQRGTPVPATPRSPGSAASVRLVPATPHPNGSPRQEWLAAARMRTLRQLRVAGILDEISEACLAPECALNCNFTSLDWPERLEADPPHLLLVESAWSPNSGGWQYGVASYPHPDYRDLSPLRALLEWCRERGIPTAFWNKEDPVHFQRFSQAAALFDHVFTTDANMVLAYEELGSEHLRTVRPLPFAAQPRLHNPVEICDERSREPAFAGTYYRNRHPDRRASLEMILDAARPFGLAIYDRTLGSQSDEYGFPERFAPNIRGRLSYRETVETYKRHRVFLNVNSVIDSPTMFSRRVFELLACGTAVISTESAGIERLFGELVPIVRTPEEATAELEVLLGDGERWLEQTAAARRLVLTEHTYRARLSEIASVAGFDLAPDGGHEVAAVALIDNRTAVRAVQDVLLAQSQPPEEITLGIGDERLTAAATERLRERFGAHRVRTVAQTQATSEQERFRELARLSAAPWIAPVLPDHSYGEHHLRHLTACADFAVADVVGAAAERSLAHRYVDRVDPSAVLISRELAVAVGWSRVAADQGRAFERGARFYSGEYAPPSETRPALVTVGEPDDAVGARDHAGGVPAQ